MGNDTPGHSYVRGIVRTIRTLIHAISRFKRKSRLHNLTGKGKDGLAQQLVQNNNAPGPRLNGQPANILTSQYSRGSQLPTPPAPDVASAGIECEFDYRGS